VCCGGSFTALFLLYATLTPALAQEQVKIGIGFGLAFLPILYLPGLKRSRSTPRKPTST